MSIGVSDFGKLVRGGYTFVDKSLLIDEVLQGGPEVTLIARPRRFGKTLNLSMLQHFLSAEVNGEPTRALFDGLDIADRPEVMAHQGRYRVIFVSLKELKDSSFEKFEAGLRSLLADLYQQYPELLDAANLNPARRRQVDALLNREASLAEMANSIKLLSELLYKHHGKKVAILLDEYDTPIHAAYTHGFYPQLMEFMRGLLGAALKDNPYLFKSVVTGILRVSKESLFSGLNNIKVYTVLDEGYDTRFGFTEAEVSGLLAASGLMERNPALESAIKDWYNGYCFGRNVIYNPWSIVNCIEERGKLQPYWVNSGGDDVLKKLMAQADADFKEGLERLIQDMSIRETVDPRLVFGDLNGDSIALWSLLLFSGYLTAEDVVWAADGSVQCRLLIPNQEIAGLYRRHVSAWFSDTMGMRGYQKFLRSLTSGEVEEFAARLQDYLLESMSLFDAQGRHPEKFYHGLALGLIAGLRDSHIVHSNRESGYGRYDLAIFPKSGAAAEQELGIIMEFKQAASVGKLKAAAKAALAQINVRFYETELRQHKIGKILRMGLAFSGKRVAVAHASGMVRLRKQRRVAGRRKRAMQRKRA